MFKLENQNFKYESEINLLKKKFDKAGEDEYFFNIREVFVTDPNQAIICIQDELLIYKNIYSNLSVHYRTLQKNLNHYDEIIQQLKCENARLERELREKDKVIITNSTNTRIMNTYSHFNKLQTDINIREEEKNNRLSTYENIKSKPLLIKSQTKLYKRIVKDDSSESTLKREKDEANEISQQYNASNGPTPIECLPISENKFDNLDISEWREVIRIVGFTESEYNSIFFSKGKPNRFSEAIDVLNTILIERNKQIDILNQENSKLNVENKKLYEENSVFHKEIVLLKQTNLGLLLKIEKLEAQLQSIPFKNHKKAELMQKQNKRANSNGKNLIVNSFTKNQNSVITINQVNINSLKQNYSIRHFEKCRSRNACLDYYKNITLPEDSSGTDFENEKFHEDNVPQTYKMSISTLGGARRKRLFSIHSAQIKNPKELSSNAKFKENSISHHDLKDTKGSINTINNLKHFKNNLTNQTNSPSRSSSMKARLFERLMISGKRKFTHQTSSSKDSEYIKIEDQKEDFFELSHNIKAINDIQNINLAARNKSKKTASQANNFAVKAIKKMIQNEINEKASKESLNSKGKLSSNPSIKEVTEHNLLGKGKQVTRFSKFERNKVLGELESYHSVSNFATEGSVDVSTSKNNLRSSNVLMKVN